MGAAGAGLAGFALYRTCKGAYKWWNEKDEKSEAVDVRLDVHMERLDALQKKIAKVDAADKADVDYARMGWGRYFLTKTTNFTVGIGSLIPSIASSVLTIMGIQQSLSIARRMFPDAGAYLLEGHTIGWCIETKTKFRESVRDLANWADDVVVNPTKRAVELQMLSLCMSTSNKKWKKL